jgi:hypothetical protein
MTWLPYGMFGKCRLPHPHCSVTGGPTCTIAISLKVAAGGNTGMADEARAGGGEGGEASIHVAQDRRFGSCITQIYGIILARPRSQNIRKQR